MGPARPLDRAAAVAEVDLGVKSLVPSFNNSHLRFIR